MVDARLHWGSDCLHFRSADKRCAKLIQRLADKQFDWLRVSRWTTVKLAARALTVSCDIIEARRASGELKDRKNAKGRVSVCIDECMTHELCFLRDGGGICGDFLPNTDSRNDLAEPVAVLPQDSAPERDEERTLFQ